MTFTNFLRFYPGACGEYSISLLLQTALKWNGGRALRGEAAKQRLSCEKKVISSPIDTIEVQNNHKHIVTL